MKVVLFREYREWCKISLMAACQQHSDGRNDSWRDVFHRRQEIKYKILIVLSTLFDDTIILLSSSIRQTCRILKSRTEHIKRVCVIQSACTTVNDKMFFIFVYASRAHLEYWHFIARHNILQQISTEMCDFLVWKTFIAHVMCTIDRKFAFPFFLSFDCWLGNKHRCNCNTKNHESLSVIHSQPIEIQHENAFSLCCKKDQHQYARMCTVRIYASITYVFRVYFIVFFLLFSFKLVAMHKNGYNPLEWSSCDGIAYVRQKNIFYRQHERKRERERQRGWKDWERES